jgi:hypothetical protein
MNSRSQAFLFGGQEFPLKSLNKHVFYLGSTGSGKTVSQRLLQQSFLPEIGQHADVGGYRALLYDAKLDQLTQLWELEDRLRCPIRLTNAFDKRASAWNVSEDITSPAAAFEMANILAPVNEAAAQPFWDRGVVNTLSGVLMALHLRAPRNWDLRTVCLIMRSEHHIAELLSQFSDTLHLARRYFQEPKLRHSLMATIDSKMQLYSVIAALWHKAKSKFTLREFRDTESIYVLGSNEEAREPMNAINRVLLRRLTELLLAQSDSDARRTLIGLDEVREAGELEGLSSLALRGRSKGVCLVAGAQDIRGLEEVYGERVAHELLGQFGYKAILKLDNPETARWASSLFAATEVKEKNQQTSRSFGGTELQITHGVGETLRERDVILPNEILHLPPTSGKAGIHGFYKSPFGSFKAQYDFLSLLRRRSDRPPLNYNFQERPETDQYLVDWTAEELERYGLTPIPPEELAFSPRQKERAPRQPRGLNNRGRNRNDGRNQSVDRDQEDEPDEDED